MTDDNQSQGRAMSREELTARAEQAGLSLTALQLDEIYLGYLHIAGMAALVRGGDRRPREAEPAFIFRAGFKD